MVNVLSLAAACAFAGPLPQRTAPPSAALLSDRALAGFGIRLGARATAHQRLAAMFKNAKAASVADVVGWHAGRGYGAKSPDQPYASLLIGEVFGSGREKRLKLLPVEPEGWTDARDLTASQAAQIAAVARLGQADFSPPDFLRSGAVFDYRSAQAPVKYRLRKLGGLLILQMIFPQPRGRAAVDYCLYYKNVRPLPIS